MGTTLADVRQAVADQLADSVGGITFYPRRPTRIQTPAAILRRIGGPIKRSFDQYVVSLELVLIVSSTLGERASEVLDGFVEAEGSGSIRGALEDDPTLGGVAVWLNVGEWGEEELIDENDVPYPGSVLPIEVGYRA